MTCTGKYLIGKPESVRRFRYMKKDRWLGSLTAMLLISALLWAAGVELRTLVEDQGSGTTAVKRESFDKDPGWEGHNNRLLHGLLASDGHGRSPRLTMLWPN
jgi:hypothetical protein